jgi:Leucine Rich repeat
MSILEHVDTFFGCPVEDYDPAEKIGRESRRIHRLAVDYEAAERGEHLTDLLAQFLADPGSAKAPGLVIGMWEEAYSGPAGAERTVAALVAARDRLPALRALFLGDITYEECEISWIQQTDVSPILAAYPALECFRVRGGAGLVLGTPRHEALRELIIESGGLDVEVVQGIAAGHLPQLEHLELWLGDSGYGATTTVEALAPILDGSRFPALKYLGLRNSEIADAIAIALSSAPVLGRLHTLDLSLGNLGDEGARALLESPAIKSLRKLDIHHHFVSMSRDYMSPGLVNALADLGIELDASDPHEADVYDGEPYRYIAHSE